jgi:hypothetical protein
MFFVELKILSWFLKYPHVASLFSIQHLFTLISKQKIVKEEGEVLTVNLHTFQLLFLVTYLRR